MRMPSLLRYAAAVASVATLLGGCNGGSSPNPTTRLVPSGLNLADRLPQGGGLDLAAARALFRPRRLWMSPNVTKGKPLLFVTAGYGSDATVNVLSMPDLVIRGQASGFRYPRGECADKNGQIWVVDSDARNITRWSRTLRMTGELDDNYGRPWSCAVDPTTGNLAVANFGGVTSGPGNVVIYAHARGSGKPIRNPKQFFYQWLGYDTSGHLWVDGMQSRGENFILSSCSLSTCSTIKITGGKIHLAGFVQWASGLRSWYVADRDGCCYISLIYPVSARGALGTPIILKDPTGRIISNFALNQGVITNAKSPVLAAAFTNSIYGGVNGLALWSFPAGGKPTHDNDALDPFGAAISE